MNIVSFFRDASIRVKILLASTIVQVILLVVLIANSVSLMDQATRAHLGDLIRQNADRLLAMVVAHGEPPDYDSLQDTLNELLPEDAAAGASGSGKPATASRDGLNYVRIVNASGEVLLSAGEPGMTALPVPDIELGSEDPPLENVFNRHIVHVRTPLLLSRNQVGFLQFGISTVKLSSLRKDLVGDSWLIAAFELLATFVLLSAVSYALTTRLKHMVTASQALAEGKLDRRLIVKGRDELAHLANHFNSMASALQQRIDDLQRSAGRLRASEERYALSIRGANDGLWDWDILAGRCYFSSRFCEMMGRSANPKTGVSTLEAPTTLFLARLHPDEAATFHARVLEHLKGVTPQFILEHRIRHEDGSYRWIMTRGVALRDEEGRAVRMAGSISDIHQRKRAEQQLQHDAMHDGLTGLPNQALFIEHLRQALAQRERDPNFHFAVLALNLERFHLINDSYSYATGNNLLCQVASHLTHSLRGGDIVARLSADQFAVLLHGLSSNEEALESARQLLELPNFTALGSQQALHVKCRIGVATSDDGNDAETLLRDADNALQSARKDASSPVQVFQASMHARVLTTLTLETELREALANQKLSVAYQPIVRLFNHNVASFEALARWNHPEKGMIQPSVFIPLAESLDLIHELSMFVLDRVCLDLLEWQHRTGVLPPPVSVNLSARQLSRPALASELLDTITGHGLAPEQLRFEVTESLLTRAGGPESETLQRLRDSGIAVLIDDFGTGYSALSYLHTIPCDVLKLDGSFVSTVTTDARLRSIVRHSIGLAHDLGMAVVAECIESERQSHMLRSIGCDFGQGYLFSKPVTAEEACRLLENENENKVENESKTL